MVFKKKLFFKGSSYRFTSEFVSLDSIPLTLSETSHIQACKNNRRNLVDDYQLISVFNCVGKCYTLRCSCCKAKIVCSTKCQKKIKENVVNKTLKKPKKKTIGNCILFSLILFSYLSI